MRPLGAWHRGVLVVASTGTSDGAHSEEVSRGHTGPSVHACCRRGHSTTRRASSHTARGQGRRTAGLVWRRHTTPERRTPPLGSTRPQGDLPEAECKERRWVFPLQCGEATPRHGQREPLKMARKPERSEPLPPQEEQSRRRQCTERGSWHHRPQDGRGSHTAPTRLWGCFSHAQKEPANPPRQRQQGARDHPPPRRACGPPQKKKGGKRGRDVLPAAPPDTGNEHSPPHKAHRCLLSACCFLFLF